MTEREDDPDWGKKALERATQRANEREFDETGKAKVTGETDHEYFERAQKSSNGPDEG